MPLFCDYQPHGKDGRSTGNPHNVCSTVNRTHLKVVERGKLARINLKSDCLDGNNTNAHTMKWNNLFSECTASEWCDLRYQVSKWKKNNKSLYKFPPASVHSKRTDYVPGQKKYKQTDIITWHGLRKYRQLNIGNNNIKYTHKSSFKHIDYKYEEYEQHSHEIPWIHCWYRSSPETSENTIFPLIFSLEVSTAVWATFPVGQEKKISMKYNFKMLFCFAQKYFRWPWRHINSSKFSSSNQKILTVGLKTCGHLLKRRHYSEYLSG